MAYKKVDEGSLTTVANAIREKAGTTELLNFPDGFVEAIAAIENNGGEVQRAEGSFTPNSSGEATIDCGFKPDLLFLDTTGSYPFDGGRYLMSGAFAFAEESRLEGNNIMVTSFPHLGNEGGYYDVVAIQMDTGFQVYVVLNDSPFTYNVNYVAVKYSDLPEGSGDSSNLPRAEEMMFG